MLLCLVMAVIVVVSFPHLRFDFFDCAGTVYQSRVYHYITCWKKELVPLEHAD